MYIFGETHKKSSLGGAAVGAALMDNGPVCFCFVCVCVCVYVCVCVLVSRHTVTHYISDPSRSHDNFGHAGGFIFPVRFGTTTESKMFLSTGS